jgi:hypothetical protein
MPNPNYLEEEVLPLKITAGKEIYLFYSDLVEQNDSPMVLYREDGNYMTDLNGDYIVNAYNY